MSDDRKLVVELERVASIAGSSGFTADGFLAPVLRQSAAAILRLMRERDAAYHALLSWVDDEGAEQWGSVAAAQQRMRWHYDIVDAARACRASTPAS